MTQYKQLAYLYDQLMSEAPYEEWCQWIKQSITKYAPHSKQVIDLGCGTGQLTIAMAEQGFHMFGVDLSEHMLTVAQQKAAEKGLPIQWIQQDMTQLQFPYEVDVIMCVCDSLNYVLQKEKVEQLFKLVKQTLKPNGLFLFDCHSVHKMRTEFGNNAFCLNDDDLAYLWQCYYDDQDDIVTHELSFFVKTDADLYDRFDEIHHQKLYPVEQLRQLLTDAGLSIKEETADFVDVSPTEQSERLFFVCQSS